MAFHPLNGQPPSIGPRPGQVGVVQWPIRRPEGVALGSLLAAAVLICCHWLSKNWPLANAEPTAININDKLFLLTYSWNIGQHAAHSEYVNQRPTQPLFSSKSFDIQAGTLYSRQHESVAEQSKSAARPIPPAPPPEEKTQVMNGFFLFLIRKKADPLADGMPMQSFITAVGGASVEQWIGRRLNLNVEAGGSICKRLGLLGPARRGGLCGHRSRD